MHEVGLVPVHFLGLAQGVGQRSDCDPAAGPMYPRALAATRRRYMYVLPLWRRALISSSTAGSAAGPICPRAKATAARLSGSSTVAGFDQLFDRRFADLPKGFADVAPQVSMPKLE